MGKVLRVLEFCESAKHLRATEHRFSSHPSENTKRLKRLSLVGFIRRARDKKVPVSEGASDEASGI